MSETSLVSVRVSQPPRSRIDSATAVRVNRLRRRAAALVHLIESLPRWTTVAAGALAVLLVGAVDRATGPLLSLTVFYLAPVVAVAWAAGTGAGAALAVAASVVWGLADRLGPAAEPRSAISYWNDATLLAVFLVVVVLVAWLRATWEYDNGLLADVQARLLPTELPAVGGCEFAAEWRPAGVVGGDTYDVVETGDGRVALCIADVSGKGMPAALVMSNVQAGLRALIGTDPDPAFVLARLNALLFANVRQETFVTLFLGILDVGAGTLIFGNAGHNPPLLVRGDGSTTPLKGGGPPLGIITDAPYSAMEVAIGRGDRLILYTDGVTEHCDALGQEFGEARLVEVARAHRGDSAGGLRDAVLAAVSAFGTGPFEDDVTILVAVLT